MAKVFVEDAIKKSGVGQHELITMAAKRAREIQNGSRPLVEVKNPHEKATVTALREIEAGLYTMDHYEGKILSAEQIAEEAKQKEEAQDEYQFTQGE